MTILPSPRGLARGAVPVALLIGAALAAGRNLAPDAVTRATTWNEHTGEVAWLTDGLAPPDTAARPFEWSTKGVLAFQWGGVEAVDRIRLRIGTVANDYQVRTYVGGFLLDEGATRDPQGEQTARVEDRTRVVDGWQEIRLPPDTEADNLELRTFGPVQLYEVEILTPNGTAVSPLPWAAVKGGARPVSSTP